MQIIERVKDTHELWQILVPHIEAPNLRECAVWCQRFDNAAIQRAFMRVGKKFPLGADLGSDGTGPYRYASSVMMNVERARVQQEEIEVNGNRI